MSNSSQVIVALDVGDSRIGVAHADTNVRFPVAYGVIEADGLEFERLREVITEFDPSLIVIGYPRNQNGEATAQTRTIEAFAEKLEALHIPLAFQDESLTSVLAEKYLKSQKKPYSKGDIDAHAAAIILGDYLEEQYGR
jgi:putative Holliday junction resolvase